MNTTSSFFWLIFCPISVTDIGNWWYKFDIEFLQDFPLKEKKMKNFLNILLLQLHVGDFKMSVFYLFYRSSKSPLICYNCNQGYNIWSREAHGSIHPWGQGLSIINFTHTVHLSLLNYTEDKAKSIETLSLENKENSPKWDINIWRVKNGRFTRQ